MALGTVAAARGVAKLLTLGGVESSYGVQAAGSGKLLRRLSSDIHVNVQALESQEIVASQQIRDSRHGPFQVQGNLSGQLSAGTYQVLLENLLRSTFAVGGSVSALADTAMTIGALGVGTLTTTGGNFVTSSFKQGDIARITADTPAADKNLNMRVTGFAASNSLTLGGLPSTATGWTSAAETGFAMSTPGKKLKIPATGQAFNSLTFEHWFSDVLVSELFTGCVINQVSINIPAAGFVTFQASLVGQQMIRSNTQVYATPAAPSSNTGLTSVGGNVFYAGVAIACITGASLQIMANVQADPVLGQNFIPAVFLGTLMVRGSISCFFVNDGLTTDFLNENEVDLSFLLTASPAAGAEFMHIYLPRVKLQSDTRNDSDRAITRQFQFTALENVGSNTYADLTTIVIQDSAAT